MHNALRRPQIFDNSQRNRRPPGALIGFIPRNLSPYMIREGRRRAMHRNAQTDFSRILRPAARIAFLAAGIAAASPGMAAQTGLSLRGAWIRFIIPSTPAAGYFTLTNATDKPQILTSASSPACGSLMMHQSVRKGEREQMNMVASVTVPAHGTLAFAPGGYHLMCVSPSKDLKVGAQVPVTLTFASGDSLTDNFPVRGVGGK
jgi:copper(I)-binding protein